MAYGYTEIGVIFANCATAIFVFWFFFDHLADVEHDVTARELLLLALQLYTLHIISRMLSVKKSTEESLRMGKNENSRLENSLEKHRSHSKMRAKALRSQTHLLRQVFYANRQMRNEIFHLQSACKKALLEKKEASKFVYDIYVARMEHAAWLKVLVILAAMPTFVPVVYFFVNGAPTDYEILCSTVAALAVVLAFAVIDGNGHRFTGRLKKKQEELHRVQNLQDIEVLLDEDEACRSSQEALLDCKPGRRISHLLMDDIRYEEYADGKQEAKQVRVSVVIGDQLWHGLKRLQLGA